MLLLPGPAKLVDRIMDAYLKQTVSPESEEFLTLKRGIIEKTKKYFDCDGLAAIEGTGTLAIEMMAATACTGKKVLCLSNGEYGGRLAKACAGYAKEAREFSVPIGSSLTLGRVSQKIDDSGAEVLALVHSETSSGVSNEVEKICSYAKEKGMVTLVDGIGSIFAADFSSKRFGVDFACCSSSMALGAPSGIGLIGLSAGAIEHAKKSAAPSYYMNLSNHLSASNPPIPTPSVWLYHSLGEAYKILEEHGGLPVNVKRHAEGSDFIRKNLASMGIQVVGEAGYHSNTVTVFSTGNPLALSQRLKERFGIEIGMGIGALSENTLRVGHLGNFTLAELDYFTSSLKELASEASFPR